MSLLINAYCTHRNPPPLDFPHHLNNRRDMSDPELDEHLNGFIGYIMKGGEREMTQSLYHVYRHLQRVQHHLSLNVDDENLDNFTAWAWQANAIIFLEDGSVRDPSGLKLVNAEDGSSEEEARLPYPEDATNRKLKNDEILQAKDIPIYDGLPPVVGECEVWLRSAEDVARRALSLFIVALRGEGLATGEEIPVAEMQARYPMAFESLSPVEQEFIQASPPDQQSIINHAWRYECLFVLQWALGQFDQLHFPSSICDVRSVARAVLDREPNEMIAQARLRPTNEILDELDMHFRLHWAARHAGEEEPPAELDIGVIQERRIALNWLTRFENADWDDVDCPT